MKQICNCCNIEKSISDFEWQKNRPSPRKTCKLCRYKNRDIRKENENSKERKEKWRKENKDILRQRWEKSKYGVCKEDLNTDSCMICGSKERLCIDHCHETNKVRGILCSKCNTGLGFFRDNISFLESAIDYLSTNQ